MPELRVDLIRHAHSAMNASMEDPTAVPFIGGRQNEVDLDVLGERQAELFGHFALDHDLIPDNVFCSPAVRTVRTHQLASRVMGLTLESLLDDRLQELDQGDWTNEPRTLYDMHAAEMRRLKSDFRPPNGESMNDVTDRITDFMDMLCGMHQDQDLGYVWVHTHGVAIKGFIGRLLGWSYEDMYRAEIPNASITTVVLQKGMWVPQSIGVPTSSRPS